MSHNEHTQRQGEAAADGAQPSRRDFLRKSGKRAIYVAPIVLSLSASAKAAASGYDSTCGDAGSPCTVDGDCCGASTCVAMVCT